MSGLYKGSVAIASVQKKDFEGWRFVTTKIQEAENIVFLLPSITESSFG